MIERLDQGHLYPLGEHRDKHVRVGARTSDPLHRRRPLYLKSYLDSLFADYSEPLQYTYFRATRNGAPRRRPYVCGQCTKSFSTSLSLQHHIRVHTGEKPYNCSQCDKSFAQSSTLQRHLKVHTGEKPYTCTQCMKSCAQSFNLKTHIMRVHTGEKRYSCSLCSKAFFLSSELKKHFTVHTKEHGSSGDVPYL